MKFEPLFSHCIIIQTEYSHIVMGCGSVEENVCYNNIAIYSLLFNRSSNNIEVVVAGSVGALEPSGKTLEAARRS